MFYREIFLDKAEDGGEIGFWLSQILSPLPLVFQARVVYILYGPEDPDQGNHVYFTDVIGAGFKELLKEDLSYHKYPTHFFH